MTSRKLPKISNIGVYNKQNYIYLSIDVPRKLTSIRSNIRLFGYVLFGNCSGVQELSAIHIVVDDTILKNVLNLK